MITAKPPTLFENLTGQGLDKIPAETLEKTTLETLYLDQNQLSNLEDI